MTGPPFVSAAFPLLLKELHTNPLSSHSIRHIGEPSTGGGSTHPCRSCSITVKEYDFITRERFNDCRVNGVILVSDSASPALHLSADQR